MRWRYSILGNLLEGTPDSCSDLLRRVRSFQQWAMGAFCPAKETSGG